MMEFMHKTRLEELIQSTIDKWRKCKDLKQESYLYQKYTRLYMLYKFPSHPNKFFTS